MTETYRCRYLSVMETKDPTWECEPDCIPDLDLHATFCLAFINDKRLEPTC